MTALSPEDYVRALYRSVLGREADPTGLDTFVTLIGETGDPTLVLAHLLGSAEYRARSAPAVLREGAIRLCLDYVAGRVLTIVDVGAQMLDVEAHAYQPLCRPDIPHQIIGFEPLMDRLEARAASEGAGSLTLLPYAIADGRAHTLYVNNDDATSSLFPLNTTLCGYFEHLHTLGTVRTQAVETRTLDYALGERDVDFLKLDIQGAERLALEGAETVLTRTGVIHCEVEFAPIYRGQCLFPEIQAHLNARGFSLIDIAIPHRYAYRNAAGVAGRDRLLWGDAVFFRDTQDPGVLASQALIAGLVYQKLSLAEHLIEAAATARASASREP